jgi:hypothetical protein
MKMKFAFMFCLLYPVIPCAAQDAASVKAFMNSAFSLYQNHGYGIYGEHGSDRELMKYFIHSSLQALIDKDVKTVAAAGTDMPYAGDSEIICDCQEHDGIRILQMDVKVVNPKLAFVVATFKIYESKNDVKGVARKIKYTLVPELGQWKIYDCLTMTPPTGGISFRKGLQKDINYYSNSPKP